MLKHFEFVLILHLMNIVLGRPEDCHNSYKAKNRNTVRANGLTETILTKMNEILENCFE